MTIKELQSLIKEIENSPLMTLELETGDFKLKLSKNKFEPVEKIQEPTPQVVEPSKVAEPTLIKKEESLVIKSPLVGTFYASPTINGNPYVEVGQPVKKGQVVCIVEAMKIMNEITSPHTGIVKEVLVKNGDIVGYDDIIMVIE
ncbi:MAG: acetyl-CoA carboxylase biotin carboxyl carrier protein [Acholeplasmataceae bacterium]|nr:acetyl-CoA carboxylase biotin carboxyl carrier protein [Acholeplasmataceae bacterium]